MLQVLWLPLLHRLWSFYGGASCSICFGTSSGQPFISCTWKCNITRTTCYGACPISALTSYGRSHNLFPDYCQCYIFLSILDDIIIISKSESYADLMKIDLFCRKWWDFFVSWAAIQWTLFLRIYKEMTIVLSHTYSIWAKTWKIIRPPML